MGGGGGGGEGVWGGGETISTEITTQETETEDHSQVPLLTQVYPSIAGYLPDGQRERERVW